MKMINRTRKLRSLNYAVNFTLSIFLRSAIYAVIVNLFSVGSGNTQEFHDPKFSTNLTSIEEHNASSETLIKEKFGNKISDISDLPRPRPLSTPRILPFPFRTSPAPQSPFPRPSLPRAPAPSLSQLQQASLPLSTRTCPTSALVCLASLCLFPMEGEVGEGKIEHHFPTQRLPTT